MATPDLTALASSMTEASSQYNDLEKMPISEILASINREDATVPLAVQRSLPQIEALVEAASTRINAGGRLFYIGAGTSGRLGILDAAECPPTYGVPFGLVIGIMAGGDAAIRKAVEFAEDDFTQAWTDLSQNGCNANDMVVGIAASGRTPYVVGGLRECQKRGIATGCIVCNPGSPVEQVADFPVVVVVGPEFVTGSTRMKAGTAQKLVLNMISTTCMIRMGRVKGNKMVDMMPTNTKLIARGVRMLMDELDLSEDEAQELFDHYGNVRKAMAAYRERTTTR